MAQTVTPIKFTSAARERDIRGICAVHGVPFNFLEKEMNESYVLIAPGSVDFSAIDIGRKRLTENPSQDLDRACYAWLRGFTLAQEKQGTGKRLPRPSQDRPDPLDDFFADLERDHWLQFVK